MNNIKLRALTEEDISKTLIWNNQEDIKDLYLGHPFPVNKEMEKLWYNNILTSNYPITVFGIEHIETKILIGLSLLKNINYINRSAEFAIFIGDVQNRKKGYSTEATKQTLDFAFFSLGLNRIFIKLLKRNKVAKHLYEKVGFKVEGILRESIFKNNRYEDECIMSILKTEYEKLN